MAAMSESLCVLRHRGDRPRRAAPGLLLCPGHRDGLVAMLDEIAVMWQLLDDVIQPTAGPNARGSGVDPAAPCRLDVLALRDPRSVMIRDLRGRPLRDDLPGVPLAVGGWARIVADELRLTVDWPDVDAACTCLRTHADWVAAQDWVDAMAGEAREVSAALHHALGDVAPPSVGVCPVQLDDGDECGGALRQDRWGAMAVECRACGTRWDEPDLRRLGLVLA